MCSKNYLQYLQKKIKFQSLPIFFHDRINGPVLSYVNVNIAFILSILGDFLSASL